MYSELNVAVISDLHCTHSSTDKDQSGVSQNSTILYSDMLRSESPLHPIAAFVNEASKDRANLNSDIVLCPGDITNCADPQGYITGWAFLEEIKETLNAKELFATIGNHDVDSRRIQKNKLPFDICKSIKHNYPFSSRKLRDQFWSEHFCIYEDEKYILLIFNSAYTHITTSDARASTIQPGILLRMSETLQEYKKEKIRIALCHHHPINHANVTNPDTDVIDKGTEFLDLLNKEKFSVLIHGHKHEIKVRYYQNLLVFCAGSFSSTQNLKETQSENVFHKFEFLGITKGLIKTWTFGSVNGWVLKRTSIFPAICGFGYHDNINDLANKVYNWFNTNSNGQLDSYTNLLQSVPDVQFLLPDQINSLEDILEKEYSISFTYDKSGIIKQISKLLQ